MLLLACDLGISIACFYPAYFYHNFILCQIQGFLIQFFSVAESLSFACITIVIFQIVILKKERYLGQLSLKATIIIVILGAAIFSVIPFFIDGYSFAGANCWINLDKKSKIENLLCQIALNYGILWVVIIWNFIAYRKILKEFTKNVGSSQYRVSLVGRMKLYPWTLVICYTPLSIFLCLKGADIDISNFAFAICLFFVRCFGLANSLIYGFTENLKKKILLGFRNEDYRLFSFRLEN
ncbi:hypothetical protein SteCoe_3705 [Stentor coeruleus]|uniref:G-protein coupled receptors family 1 profile domain-containing protein n=1 Tax=Stentor coeruleus TaxID=5963 RepID=A0A1R2CWI5_9CILI|nr:hypothetical protein SteCoe_3705 [Stentor coeruleus]